MTTRSTNWMKKLNIRICSQNESAIAAVETTIPQAVNLRMKCATNVRRKATRLKYAVERRNPRQTQDKPRRRQERKQRTHFVEESADQNDVYAMYHSSSNPKKSFKVDFKLCGRKIMMEIATGETKTVLNDALGPLQNSKAVLSRYTRGKIPVVGAVMVPVKYGNQQQELEALVVKGSGPNLLGRDWLQVIHLDCNNFSDCER